MMILNLKTVEPLGIARLVGPFLFSAIINSFAGFYIHIVNACHKSPKKVAITNMPIEAVTR